MNSTSSEATLSDSQKAARKSHLVGCSLVILIGLADKLFLVLAAFVGVRYLDFPAMGYWQYALLLPAILLLQLGRELCRAPFSFIGHQKVGPEYFKNYTWRVWWQSVKRNSCGRLLQTTFIVLTTYAALMSPCPLVFLCAAPLIAIVAFAILPWEKSTVEPRDVTHEACTDEALLSRIEPLLTEVGLKRESVKIVKLSEKATMSNAWMCGSQVWLGDTLLANCSEAAVDSVVGHELGHYYHRHGSLFSAFHIWVALMIGFLTVLHAYPESFQNWLVSIPMFLLGYELARMVLKRWELAVSRRNERQADEYSLNKVGAKGARELREGMSGVNRPWENPWPILVWLFSTHPSVAQRSAHIDEWERRRNAVTVASPCLQPSLASTSHQQVRSARNGTVST